MQPITDEYMQQMLMQTRTYILMVLKPGPHAQRDDLQPLLWEHARNNFKLRAEGLLSIVCPVAMDRDIAGIGIFNTDEETVHRLLKDDPAIREGVFVYELMPVRSFPGDRLPA